MILTRHLTPTLVVVGLATAGPLTGGEPDAPHRYPTAPTPMPIDGHYHPCTHPSGVNVICSVQFGDAP